MDITVNANDPWWLVLLVGSIPAVVSVVAVVYTAVSARRSLVAQLEAERQRFAEQLGAERARVAEEARNVRHLDRERYFREQRLGPYLTLVSAAHRLTNSYDPRTCGHLELEALEASLGPVRVVGADEVHESAVRLVKRHRECTGADLASAHLTTEEQIKRDASYMFGWKAHRQMEVANELRPLFDALVTVVRSDLRSPAAG